MSISAVSGSTSMYQPDQSKMEQMKKSFDGLGSALQSGNLEDAKKAFADLKKNAPSQGAGGNDPMSKDMDAVQKALDSGDVKGAQEAFSKIQEKMSQGPPQGAPAGGKPQGNQQDTVSLSSEAKAAAQNGSSSSNSTSYDKMDANQDGTVTAQERLEYETSHAKESDSSTSNSSTSNSTTALSLSSAHQQAAAKAYA
jgi:soluble cytochrome b562